MGDIMRCSWRFVGKSMALAIVGAGLAGWSPAGYAQDPFSNFLNALGGQKQQPQRQRPQPQRQQTQSGDPFGAFMQGLFGVPNQQAPSNNQKTIAPGTGDPIAAALRQIDVAKGIQQKAQQLQGNVLDVVTTIKVFQAANGAMWLEIGKHMSAMNKLDEQADAVMVKRFISATQNKRNAYRSALKSVVLNPSADIEQSNQTLAANTAKVSRLRQSVAALVNEQSRSGAFETLVRKQNIPLDAMMNAYIARIEDVVATMDSATTVFSDMSREYQVAQGNMGKAISTFEEQGGLVAAEASKQVGILALEIARLTEIVNNGNDNPLAIVLGVVQGVQILQDLQSLTETLNGFQETMDWFDNHSQQILSASQGARQELGMSVQTLQSIRPQLVSSWQSKIATVSKIATSERKRSLQFDKELAKSLAKAKAKAPAMAKQDLDEMQFMKKKSLRS